MPNPSVKGSANGVTQVRCTLSVAGARRHAVVAPLPRTLGITKSAVLSSSKVGAFGVRLNSHEAAPQDAREGVRMADSCRHAEDGSPGGCSGPADRRATSHPKRQPAKPFRAGGHRMQVLHATASNASTATADSSCGYAAAQRRGPRGSSAWSRTHRCRATRSRVPSSNPAPVCRGPVLPNPSFNRTRYGRPPWPGRRYAVHFRQPGQGVPPPRAG